jgi:hypothetical protein
MLIAVSASHVHVPCMGCITALSVTITVMKAQKYPNKYLVIQFEGPSV